MKRILTILLLFFMMCTLSNAQVSLKTEVQRKGLSTIPQERVFVHSNTSLFLTGEYLYYSIYSFNNETNALSNISRVAYVELVNSEGTQFFKQKIKLKNGLGHGDFFIPVSAPTGSYKLVAYTNWMKNKGLTDFYKGDVHIINPYQVSKISFQKNDTIDTAETLKPLVLRKNSNIGPVQVVLKNQDFNRRSKVSFSLEAKNKNEMPSGSYSISVRKKGKLPEPTKQNLMTNFNKFESKKENLTTLNSTSVYLPELRGELLSGKVISKNNTNVKGLKIAISIPGDNYYIDVALTNDDGNFYINIDKDYSGDRIFLEVLDKPTQVYTIKMNETTSLDYSKLTFENLELNPSMKDEIVQRSIHNQIDNAYFKYKPDSVVSTISQQFFDSKKGQNYKLDDFTRFKTVRETIFEVFKDISVSRFGKENSVLLVQGYNDGTNSGVLPLILIDGFQITDHNALLDYSALSIDEIEVFRDHFVLGSKVYQGALLFKTKNNNIESFQNNPSLFSHNLLKPQMSKKYFTQRYDSNTASRIPDDRLQLLWIPNLTISEKLTVLDFYTSDVTGEFEICIEGFTSKQEPVSVKTYFSVK